MRTTYTISEEAYHDAIALSSFLSVYKHGGSNITAGFAIGVALREYFDNHPEAAAHRDILKNNKE